MDCMTLGNDIAKVSLALNGYVREVREARADVDGISRELHSLQSVLDLLQEDTELFPRLLAGQTPIVLEHCTQLVEELDYCFSILNRVDLPKQDKRKLWAARGKKETSRFKPALEAHRALIGLALDLVEATTPRDALAAAHDHDVEDEDEDERTSSYSYEIENEHQQQPEYGSSTIENVSRIIGELGSLRIRLAKEFEKKDPEYVLHEYMVSLKSYGEAVISGTESEYYTTATDEQGAYMGENELFGAYIGDEPDSAIGLHNNESVLQTLRDAITRNADYGGGGGGVHPIIDDIIEEEEEQQHAELEDVSRAPTPPPKDVKRRELARRRSSMVVSPSFQMPIPIPRSMSNDSSSPTDSQFAVVTETETVQSQESKNSQEEGSLRQTQSHQVVSGSGSSSSQESASPPTPKSSRFSKILGSVRRKTSYERPATAAAAFHPPLPISSSRPSGEMRPSTPVLQGSLVRRGSRRLSVTFKKLPMWNAEIDQLLMGTTDRPDTENTDGSIGVGGDPVFGVPLQKSIAVAKGTAKTHHSGGGRASRREYPLCVQKSCLYIKEEGGVSAPNIFADPGDPRRVQALKETFSRAPGYGSGVDWDAYGPHDAADVVLLFLAQLPKPLVTESAARRWVALSRQAMVSKRGGGGGGGGGGVGLGGGKGGVGGLGRAARPWEECIDFWEEALGAIRGGPSRSLFKLLLNLWADVAAAAEHNDMTAERLASCVLKPLMHVSPADRHETDFVLALAFLIRRRGEYVDMLRMEQDHQNQNQRQKERAKDLKAKVKRISMAGW